MVLIAYLIPSIPSVKNVTLGASFQGLILFLGVIGAKEIFSYLHDVDARRKVRWPSMVAAIVLLPAIIFCEMRPHQWNRGDPSVVSSNRESDFVFQTLAAFNGSKPGRVLVTTEGRVTGFIPLQFRAMERGLPYEFYNLDPFVSIQDSADRFDRADFVLAAEGNNPDSPDFLPTSKAADQTLAWVRGSGKFREIGSVAGLDGHRYFLFVRQSNAGVATPA